MIAAHILWLAAAAAMIPAALRLRGPAARAERAGLAGAAVVFAAVALGFVRPDPAPAALAGLGLAGWLPAFSATLRGGRLRPEVWLIASAGLGLLALSAMAGDLPLGFLATPVFAQAASLGIGLAALGEEDGEAPRPLG